MFKVIISYSHYKSLFILTASTQRFCCLHIYVLICSYISVCMHAPTYVNRFTFFIIIYMCSRHVCRHACVYVYGYMYYCTFM